jgi:uncharacterized protein
MIHQFYESTVDRMRRDRNCCCCRTECNCCNATIVPVTAEKKIAVLSFQPIGHIKSRRTIARLKGYLRCYQFTFMLPILLALLHQLHSYSQPLRIVTTHAFSNPVMRRLPPQLFSINEFIETVRYRSISRYDAVILYMGKGDGKKKRTKKETTTNNSNSQHTSNSNGGASHSHSHSSSSSSSTPKNTASLSSSPPLRVSSNVNIPVRQQIAIAQMNKILRQQQQQIISAPSSNGGGGGGSASSSSPSISMGVNSKPRVRTAYRRTWEEEEIIQKAEERKRRGQEPDWDVILNRTAVSPLLIVDGYNIIHAWPRLKKHMTKGDTGRARQLLIDDLENLQSIKGWRIECVFDGTRRSTIGPLGSGPGSTSSTTTSIDQVTKQSMSKYGVRVVYSGVGTEADTYIESRCIRAKNVTNGEITGSFIVATDDAMIRLSGQSAGAVCMSASRFVDELKAVQKAIAYRVEAAVAKVNGHAIRPEQLRRTDKHVAMPTRFGRQSVVMVDKRNRTKVNKKDEMIDEEYESYLSTVLQQHVNDDENGIPWWAKAPEPSSRNFYKT